MLDPLHDSPTVRLQHSPLNRDVADMKITLAMGVLNSHSDAHLNGNAILPLRRCFLGELAQAYGYMRIEQGSSADPDDLRQQLIEFARSQGYELAEIFVEPRDPAGSAFAALIEALRGSGIQMVIVPTMRHLAHLESVQLAMKELLESEAGARILAATGAGRYSPDMPEASGA
jgi:hypothetical protein